MKDKKIKPSLINENIPFDQVLLVGEEKIVLSKQNALAQAQKANLTLLCVAPQADPPVCKLVDYQKYLFELKKREKTKKPNTNKEIRFSFAVAGKEWQEKLNKIHHWLERGFRVKVNLLMAGREKSQSELAREKCQKIITELKSQSEKIELQGSLHSQTRSFSFFLSKNRKV